jgi:hypothetical protein
MKTIYLEKTLTYMVMSVISVEKVNKIIATGVICTTEKDVNYLKIEEIEETKEK